MSNAAGVIKRPVDFRRDIYPVPGMSPAGGNYALGYACTDPQRKINKWSKIKPVEIEGAVFVHLDTDTVSMPHPFTGTHMSVPAWLGRMYTESVVPSGASSTDEILLAHVAGIGVPLISGTNTATDSQREATARRVKRVADNLDAWDVNWKYVPPVPPRFPARATDWDGYDHNARCPIYYAVSSRIYNGEHAWFQCSLIPEGQTAIDVTWFCKFFTGYQICVAWFRGESFIGWLEIEPLESGRGETALSPDAFYTLTGANAGEYKAYFFATDGDRSIIFPSLPDSPNPQVFTAVQGNNPRTDPFAGALRMDVYASGTGFAHSHSSTYFESFWNVGEGDYVSMCTTGYYCLKARVFNNSSTAVKFQPSKLTAYWEESGSSPSITVYTSSGTVAPADVEVPTGGSVDILIEFIDVFLGMSPTQGTQYGFIDPMSVRYAGSEILSFTCDVTYDTAHNGYFRSGYSDTYYKTK